MTWGWVLDAPWLLAQALTILLRHRRLTWELSKREITDLYAGSVLGPGWAVLHPLALMAVYVVVFTFVFKVRVTPSGGEQDYVIYLMSGYLPWMACSMSLTKSAMAISGNANLVKQVVFPIEVLPVKGVLASLVPQVVGTLFLGALTIIQGRGIPWTFALVPVLLVLEAGILIGLGWALSAIGAYLRDLKDVLQVFLLAIMYLLPIFYLPESVPGLLRPLVLLNPFSYVLYLFQGATFYGSIGSWRDWGVSAVFAAVALYVGFRVFQKLKVYFGNVL